MLTFVDDGAGPCPVCGRILGVEKTTIRNGATLEHGSVLIVETVRTCGDGCRQQDVRVRRRSPTLERCFPPRCVFGYDVMVHVGRQRFVHHRQRKEIRADLEARGIHLSTGEISTLSRRFLCYLEALHNAHIDELRAAMRADGGWPMHVDATCEAGRGTLLVVYAGWRGWALGAWKVPTERADVILPRLHQIVGRFGAPCAIMRDLGRAVTLACSSLVEELGLSIPILACHLHFLKDIGTDLLRRGHERLRELFRRFAVRKHLRTLARDLGRRLGTEIGTARDAVLDWQKNDEPGHRLPAGLAGLATVRAVTQWVLDFAADGTDAGFPFDLPHLDLYERCRKAARAADAFSRASIDDRVVRNAVLRLRRILTPVESEVPFRATAELLGTRRGIFTELRESLRLSPKPVGPRKAQRSLSPPTAESLADIQAALRRLEASLRERRPERGPAQDERQAIDIVLEHLERHGPTLFGHVIAVDTEAGPTTRVVDRTNNDLETFFKTLKHDGRRRTGKKHLAKDLEEAPASIALVQNLHDPEYVRIMAGSLDGLAGAFAALDAADRRQSIATASPSAELDVATASLPAPDRKLVRRPAMQRRLHAAASSRPPRPKASTVGG